MNRRRFLSILAGTAAASTVSYFLPPIGGWHSDVIAHAPEWGHMNYSLGFQCPSEIWSVSGQRAALERAKVQLEEHWQRLQRGTWHIWADFGPVLISPTIEGFN